MMCGWWVIKPKKLRQKIIKKCTVNYRRKKKYDNELSCKAYIWNEWGKSKKINN